MASVEEWKERRDAVKAQLDKAIVDGGVSGSPAILKEMLVAFEDGLKAAEQDRVDGAAKEGAV